MTIRSYSPGATVTEGWPGGAGVKCMCTCVHGCVYVMYVHVFTYMNVCVYVCKLCVHGYMCV